MKKLIFGTALIILATAFASANSPGRVLTFKDAFGKILTMPVMEEKEKEEAFPFDQKKVFHQAALKNSGHIIDISGMSRPEAEVDDIPAELRNIIAR